MELPIWYRFLSNPFSCLALKFKLHWYKIGIRVTKSVRVAGFFWNTLYYIIKQVLVLRNFHDVALLLKQFTTTNSIFIFELAILSSARLPLYKPGSHDSEDRAPELAPPQPGRWHARVMVNSCECHLSLPRFCYINSVM